MQLNIGAEHKLTVDVLRTNVLVIFGECQLVVLRARGLIEGRCFGKIRARWVLTNQLR